MIIRTFGIRNRNKKIVSEKEWEENIRLLDREIEVEGDAWKE